MSELLEDELFETIEELRDQIHNLTMDLRHTQSVNDDLNREIMEYQKGLDAESDEYVEEIKKQEEKNKSVFVELDRAVMAKQALEVELDTIKKSYLRALMYLETIRVNGEKVLNSTEMQEKLVLEVKELHRYYSITKRKTI